MPGEYPGLPLRGLPSEEEGVHGVLDLGCSHEHRDLSSQGPSGRLLAGEPPMRGGPGLPEEWGWQSADWGVL